MENKIILKQKKFTYLNSIFQVQALINSIIPIFYMSKLNISLDKYIFLDSILFVLVAIFEMPSGFISDKFGRKNILILGKIFVLISMLVLLFSKSFMGGLITIVLIAIGSSLISGNITSILYDYFNAEDEDSEFEKIISNSDTINYICTSAFSLIAPIILKINLDYILILDILICIVNILFTYFLLYDDRNLYKRKTKKLNRKNNIQILKNKVMIKTLLVFVLASFVFCIFRVGYNFYQPLYQDYKVDLSLYGVIFIIFNILAAFGSQIYKKISNKFEIKINLYAILLLVIILTSTIMYISKFNIIIIILLICAQQVIRGFSGSLQSVAINKAIPKDTQYRTTYISLFNTVSTISCSLFIYLSSFVSANNINLYALIKINIIISILVLLVFVFYKLSNKNE